MSAAREESKVEGGIGGRGWMATSHYSRLRRARDLLMCESGPPRAEDVSIYTVYCSISESNVLLDHGLRELIQSTGDLVIMNQYICITQNRSLCLGEGARLIHSSQFCLLWKRRRGKLLLPRPRRDITLTPEGPAVARRHVDSPVFAMRKRS